MRQRTILLGLSLVGLLSQCGPAAPPQGALRPTSTPPRLSVLASPMPGATSTPSPQATLPPSVIAPVTVPISPVLTTTLPADRTWIMGALDDRSPTRLLAITPGQAPLLFPHPIRSVVPRPEGPPLVAWGDATTTVLADPITGWMQELPGIDIASWYSGIGDPANQGVLLTLTSGVNGHPGPSILHRDHQGILAQTRITGVDPWDWDFPEILLWDGPDVYISTHASATRYVWHVRLDVPEQTPTGIISLGHGGPIWLTSNRSQLVYPERTNSPNRLAFDRTSGQVTPFRGDDTTLHQTEALTQTVTLPGITTPFSVVFLP